MCRSKSISINQVSPSGTPERSERGVTLRTIREVWAWNFEDEMQKLLEVAGHLGADATIGLDVEFPAVACEEPWAGTGDRSEQYETLRDNLDLLWPIQVGLAIADAAGLVQGAWSFNLTFETASDLNSQSGVCSLVLGRHLADSALIGNDADSPLWITFGGSHDLGYLLKILTGKPLPEEVDAFDASLDDVCPKRTDVQEQLLRGSLQSVLCIYGVHRCGIPSAGSNALATLDLHFQARSIAKTPLQLMQWEPAPAKVVAESSAGRPRRRWGVARASGASQLQPVANIHEVWAWNFDEEIATLIAYVGEVGPHALIAVDVEFPTFATEEPWPPCGDRSACYEMLLENLDSVWPIQMGLAIASADGTGVRAWSFNFIFDTASDSNSQAGVSPVLLGQRLAASLLGRNGGDDPWLMTFGGSLDLGYFLKVLTGRPLPEGPNAFDSLLAAMCPNRIDLLDRLPQEPLDSLLSMYGVQRCGAVPTGGSNALATLDLHFRTKWMSPRIQAVAGAAQDLPNQDQCSYEAAVMHSTAEMQLAPVTAKVAADPPKRRWGTVSSSSEAMPQLCDKVHEVWSWNFDEKLAEFLSCAGEAGPNALIALDVEFPAFGSREPWPSSGDRSDQYELMCENLDLLWPIQIGLAIASADGARHGAWSFNLVFDTPSDSKSHSGVSPVVLGQILADSPLIGTTTDCPSWVTCGGSLDLGYLLKIVSGKSLPEEATAFDAALADVFPKRIDLQDGLENNSLDRMRSLRGVSCLGAASTAHGNAVLTLDLYFCADPVSDTTLVRGRDDPPELQEISMCQFSPAKGFAEPTPTGSPTSSFTGTPAGTCSFDGSPCSSFSSQEWSQGTFPDFQLPFVDKWRCETSSCTTSQRQQWPCEPNQFSSDELT